jgi:hypothetical protein
MGARLSFTPHHHPTHIDPSHIKATTQPVCDGGCFRLVTKTEDGLVAMDSRTSAVNGHSAFYVQRGCPNETPCTLQRCRNFLMCGAMIPPQIALQYEKKCIRCFLQLGDLDIFESSDSTEECPICYNNTPHRVRMSCGNQNHNICTKCFNMPNILYKPSITSESFGCPRPYPYAICYDNPIEDKANKDAQDVWRNAHPVEWGWWRKDVETSRDRHWALRHERKESMQKCPLCRGSSPWNGNGGI